MRILTAARELFITNGYAATTIAAIARDAEVSPDTVYATVGRKPVVFRELIEIALSGTAHAVPGARRDYAVRMRAEPDIGAKLRIYADAVTALQSRLSPLFVVLRAAADADPDLADLWTEITRRRADNMRHLAADLAGSGRLRADLTIDEVADIIWTMNGSEYFTLLVVERGWTRERFADWLHDAWCRLLVVTPPTG
ncbi:MULTISPECIES: TetR family transcriptional regulator [Gordonia]|nr:MULTISPECIES: TetR family transcriptional regulator [Gordonia]WLP91131.1 TetR family transcriptional regulator [Gordonia sp. NB41Y]